MSTIKVGLGRSPSADGGGLKGYKKGDGGWSSNFSFSSLLYSSEENHICPVLAFLLHLASLPLAQDTPTLKHQTYIPLTVPITHHFIHISICCHVLPITPIPQLTLTHIQPSTCPPQHTATKLQAMLDQSPCLAKQQRRLPLPIQRHTVESVSHHPSEAHLPAPLCHL